MTTNELIHEKSPYLQQHAHNPINWLPWGEAAFSRAVRENKPVFLSIGYSTCHWCHVMAQESFEDAEVAELLNDKYVSIKVDREERPDVDAVYMQACQAMTGQGGWPLTLLLTPDQRPFFAATYLPRTSRYGSMGLLEVLEQATALWEADHDAILAYGQSLCESLASAAPVQPQLPTCALALRAARHLMASYDRRNGGFGPAPKFPMPHNLLFLMHYAQQQKSSQAMQMVTHTLHQMYRGGIFDHIGGGFSRYSTDEQFLAPHFEKMLYDNALLLYTYAEAYERTQEERFRQIAEMTAGYVLCELTDPETGAFFCAQDADAGGQEGAYYVFEPEEIQSVLGEAADAFCKKYDVTEHGNFEGKSIINLLSSHDDTPMDKATAKLLYDYRQSRMPLHRDEKILTSGNGLMIAALAKAGRILQRSDYTEAAVRAQDFVQTGLTDDAGRLYVRCASGQAAGTGGTDDYAFVAWGLLELYQSTFDEAYLREAVRLCDILFDKFSDAEDGGLFLYASDAQQLIIRPKETYDGALPSGNAAALYVSDLLCRLTAQPIWQQRRDTLAAFLAGAASEHPWGSCFAMLTFLSLSDTKGYQIVCVAREREALALDALSRLRDAAVLVKTQQNAAALEAVAPFTAQYPISDTACYYVCENGRCHAPVTSIEQVLQLCDK